jgi:hypothetical protein
LHATYVLYAPRSKRAELRAALTAYDGARIAWRERKLLFGSEFSMTGPAAAVRQAHAAAVDWLHQFPF